VTEAKVVVLTLEWDSYDFPTELSLFGLDAEIAGIASEGKTVWFPHKADIAWRYLVDNGFVPATRYCNGKRKTYGSYVRPIHVTFRKH
jgi:hypothetical protein